MAAAAVEITAGMARAAALGRCQYCHGFGSRPFGREKRLAVCDCALRRMFRECLAHYRELRGTVGRSCGHVCLQVTAGDGHLAMGYGNKSAEYLADVEMAARRTLTAEEFDLFRLHFAYGLNWRECCPRLKLSRGNFFHLVYVVERKLGRAFAQAGIYPSRMYFGGHLIEANQVGRCHAGRMGQ
jgi:hypothetical protein